MIRRPNAVDRIRSEVLHVEDAAVRTDLEILRVDVVDLHLATLRFTNHERLEFEILRLRRDGDLAPTSIPSAPLQEKAESCCPFVDLFVVVPTRQHRVAFVLRTEDETFAQIHVGTDAGVRDLVGAILRLHDRRLRTHVDHAGADLEKRRYAPLRERRHDDAGGTHQAVGVVAQHLRADQLETDVLRECERTGRAEDARAAEIAGAESERPASLTEFLESVLRKVDHLAVEVERARHLRDVHPTLFAARGTHLVPLGLLFQDRDAVALRRYVEDRITASGTGVQIDVRIGNDDFRLILRISRQPEHERRQHERGPE